MRMVLAISAALGLIGSTQSAIAETRLVLTTLEYPPLTFANPAGKHEITGIATEVVREIMERTGIKYEIRILPWQRAFSMAKTQADTCVYATTLTESRLPNFKWVAPILENKWAIFAKKDSKISIKSLGELKQYRVGGLQGSGMAKFLEKNGVPMELTVNNGLNARKLEAGRVDLWASSAFTATYLAKREGAPNIENLLTFKRTWMGLACNASVPDDLIAKLNQALRSVVADGRHQKIMDKYR